MQKQLSTDFSSRQYMQSTDYEVFYYHDIDLNHISTHQHNYYELYFFLEGDVVYEIEEQSYALQYGDYLLIPPGQSHRPVFGSGKSPYRRFVLWLGIDYFKQLCLHSPDFSYSFDYALSQQAYHIRTDFINKQAIHGKLLNLIEEHNGTRAFHTTNTHLMIASLLLYLNRITYDLLHQVSPRYENVLYLNICDYINNHLSEDLSLEHLSSFFYVSKYHISHIFKDNMGISLHQYIIKKRLQASKNGILSGLLLHQLCQQYGFHDYTSFYRAFKKEFGLSPKEFREHHLLAEDMGISSKASGGGFVP